MKKLRSPVLTTVMYGLVCGLSLIPLNLALNGMLFGFGADCLTLWVSAAGYGILLCRWSGTGLISICFPLLFLGLTILGVQSRVAYFVLALAVVAWIRSGICFQEAGRIRIWIELLLCAAGGGMVALFSPATTIAWALGIWLFFLLQAIYLVLLNGRLTAPQPGFDRTLDPFERSSRQALDILTRCGID